MQSLYKSPGSYVLGNYATGITFDCIAVAEADIEAHLDDGWSLTPDAALAALSQADEPQDAEAPKRRGRPPKVKP
jgi:hypothetical protein